MAIIISTISYINPSVHNSGVNYEKYGMLVDGQVQKHDGIIFFSLFQILINWSQQILFLW